MPQAISSGGTDRLTFRAPKSRNAYDTREQTRMPALACRANSKLLNAPLPFLPGAWNSNHSGNGRHSAGTPGSPDRQLRFAARRSDGNSAGTARSDKRGRGGQAYRLRYRDV